MEKKKVVMLIIALAFLIGVVLVAYDMGKQTTSPWEKRELLREKYQVK